MTGTIKRTRNMSNGKTQSNKGLQRGGLVSRRGQGPKSYGTGQKNTQSKGGTTSSNTNNGSAGSVIKKKVGGPQQIVKRATGKPI